MLSVSVVVPCFRGEETLEDLIMEIRQLSSGQVTERGIGWKIDEVILVWDGASEELADRITTLVATFPFVKPVWLSKNSGQHAATYAGLRNASGDWIVTLDEDGQHNPSDVGILIHAAYENRSLLVYGRGNQSVHQGLARTAASKVAKVIASFFGLSSSRSFQSFRLVWGDLGRAVGFAPREGIFLDVALGWYVNHPTSANVKLREGAGIPSSYSFRKLLSHFWALFISVGPHSLRYLGAIGVISAITGFGFGTYFLIQASIGTELPTGWASQVTFTLFFSGFIMIFLGLISEYLSSVFSAVLGRPAFFEVTRPFGSAIDSHSKQQATDGHHFDGRDLR